MKTMIERMMDATDILIAKEHPYEAKHHDLEKAMAIYERKASTLFCHVIEVEEWHDMEKDERQYIENYMLDYMLNQEEINLGIMTIALAEFVVKDGDKALVRIEYSN